MAFVDTKNQAYVSLANDIASESEATQDHAARMNLAKQMATGGGSIDWYVTIDANAQGYNEATPLATVKNRISALITNLVKLGFGA